MKSFKPKAAGGDAPPAGGGRNAERDFHGERRSNATHASTPDPDARLARRGRGKEARPCHMGHLLMEYRNGLFVEALVTEASGARRSTAGPRATPAMPRASASASGSRRASAGSRPWAACARPTTAAAARVGWLFTLTAAACNRVRLPKLLAAG